MSKGFQELLKEVRELHKKYHTVVEGRRDIINEIRRLIKEIRKETPFCNPELDELEKYYSYRDYYISDYEMVMSLLLRLANSNGEKYSLREVTTTDFYDIGNNEANRLYSKVLFITDNSIVDKFGELNHGNEFMLKASKYINKGHSMIVITSNLFDSKIKPRKDDVKCDKVFDIRNSGIIGNITCYINSLELQENINKFINYVNINGPDFTGIDEDTLFELMNNTKSKQKRIKKD